MGRATFKNADSEFGKVTDFFKDESRKIRSGRANPDLVSSVIIEAYGQQMPLEQLANINVADPTLLVVQPWDKTITSAVVKGIEQSNIGINPVVDGDLIRLPLPPLTQERREEYVKLLKQKTEEARVSVRQIRKDIIISLESEKEKGDISEDDMKRAEKQLQEKVDATNKRIEEIFQEKEKELMSV